MYAGDSTVVSFSIGNRYAFGGAQHCHGNPNDTWASYSEVIISDTVINGHKYSIILRSQDLHWVPRDTGVIFYRRADSSSVYQYVVSAAREDTIVNFNDTIGTVYESSYTILGKFNQYVFGRFYPTIYMMPNNITYAPKFFLIGYSLYSGLCETDFGLRGAKIDGVYYGDSTLVSVNSNFTLNPICFDYLLYQNFPNPFNPITNIEYYNTHEGFVSLNVYDVLGRKVAVLVDGVVTSGRHIVSLNGSILSSGIYYCRLLGGSSVQTKKLILLK